MDYRWYKGKYPVVIITYGGNKHQVAPLAPIPVKYGDTEEITEFPFIARAQLLWRHPKQKKEP